MDGMSMGTPWLDYPLVLESSRDYTCKFNDTAMCEYYEYRWRFWYIADIVYAEPTVGFFSAVIAFFTILYLTHRLTPISLHRARSVRYISTVRRWLSYRMYRMSRLDWNSAPLGVLILGGIGAIYFILMIFVPQPYYWPLLDNGMVYGDSPALATRSGWLSLACLPFVIATAGKSNLITLVTGVSYERLQVFHRWISYAFFATALLHTFPFIVYNISMGQMIEAWNGSLFYWTGVVALLAQAYLTFASMGPLRNLSYEWFKFSHFIAALVFVLFLFFHCDYTLTSWDYFIATGVLFSLSWLHRQIRTYIENGIKHRAMLDLTGNGMIEITVPTTLRWVAGQHFFIRFFGMGVHTLAMHPFSVCSLPTICQAATRTESKLVFLVQPQSGMTARLLERAQEEPNEVFITLDGPYGGIEMQQLENSDKILLIAGGSGAGWIIPLIAGYLRRTQRSPRLAQGVEVVSLNIVLSSRDSRAIQWFLDTLESLFIEYENNGRTAGVHIDLHYTRLSTRTPFNTSHDVEKAAATSEVKRSLSEEASILSDHYSRSEGRPDLPSIVKAHAASLQKSQRLAVFVCGPLSMQHDVANGVAGEQFRALKRGNEITLHMEHFSWA